MRIGALYIRVSTDDQVEYSPEAQIRVGLEYAKKNNIVIPKEYIFQDDGISGRKASNRPEFQKMISLAKSEEHPFEVILVWKFSRFARNQEEAIVYKNLLKKSGVEVVSVSEPIPEGFIGDLVQRIFEWMDEYYSINLSGEVMRGMTQRAMAGECNGSPPLGYIMENGKPVVCQEQAEIVKRIFHMYVYERLSFFDIAKKLNAIGCKTKRGGKFQNRTVAYIIRNEFYIGKIIWNKTDHVTRKLKDPSEWITKQGNFETFIPVELFNQAQTIDKATSKRKKVRPASTYKHWLSGLLVCSSCGGRLVRCHTNKSGISSFQCSAYNHGSCDTSHMISESKLAPAIIDGLKNALDGGDIVFEVNKVSAKEKADIEYSLLENQLRNISNKEQRIKEAYQDGIDTLDEYRENKKLLQQEKEYLSNLLQQNQPKDNQKEMHQKLLANIKSAYDVIASSDVNHSKKHEALASIVDKIVFDKKNDAIAIHFYINS